MHSPQPWLDAYPHCLRDYAPDLSTLPAHPGGLAAAAARRFGERAAFTVMLPGGASGTLSFAQVDALSGAFAAYLAGPLGLKPGDVVGVQLPNSLHYPVAVLGAWRAGLIVTNINPLYTPRELEHQLRDSGARALVACDLFAATAAGVIEATGVTPILASLADFLPAPVAAAVRQGMPAPALALPHVRFMDALEAGRALGPLPERTHGTALYQYTGGTTGRSKGAVVTAANVLSAVRMASDFMAAYGKPFREGDTALTVLPLYHVFAFVLNFLAYLNAGAHNLLIPNPRPLANLRPAFEAHRIDWFAGVDTLYAGLLAEPWFRELAPRVGLSISGGTALRPATSEAWRAAVGPVVEGYGLTESTCIVACSPPGAGRPGTVGVPMPGCEVRIVDAGGADAPPGTPGEIVVRGPQIVPAYLNQPEETEAAFAGGWLRTGDIGMFEEGGHLRILDRSKDVILVSGFNVYPNEVEAVIASHPGVAEVAVIGVPDPRTGEAVHAFVAPRGPGLDAAALIRHCRDNLAAYKVPREVTLRDQLPKSPVGKILRAALRDPAGNGAGG
ncbi:MAG TPA: AMP-binding protein [Azospirillaceae bacterium]|nr:AMP-binding protein [Azospirillaceae bacterium]